MRESMPDTNGWVDRGPRKMIHSPYAGQVHVIREGSTCAILEPLDSTEVRDIVKQGRDRPRPLNDRTLAAANHKEYARAVAEFEAWAHRECGSRPKPLGATGGGTSEYVPE